VNAIAESVSLVLSGVEGGGISRSLAGIGGAAAVGLATCARVLASSNMMRECES
jgi:hypothetical protein